MQSNKVVQRDFLLSLGIVGLIVVLALGRLAIEGNWPKVLRVALAFLTYVAALLSLTRFVVRCYETSATLPLWIFAVSAGAAELASGWLRPDWRFNDTFTMPAVAALIGCLHWLALRMWRPTRGLWFRT